MQALFTDKNRFDDSDSDDFETRMQNLYTTVKTILVPKITGLEVAMETILCTLRNEVIPNLATSHAKAVVVNDKGHTRALREALQRNFECFKFPAEYKNMKTLVFDMKKNIHHVLPSMTDADLEDLSKSEEIKSTVATKLTEIRSEEGKKIREYLAEKLHLDTTEIDKIYGKAKPKKSLSPDELDNWHTELQAAYKRILKINTESMEDVNDFLLSQAVDKFGDGLSNRAFLRVMINHYVTATRPNGDSSRDVYFNVKSTLRSIVPALSHSVEELASENEMPEKTERLEITSKKLKDNTNGKRKLDVTESAKRNATGGEASEEEANSSSREESDKPAKKVKVNKEVSKVNKRKSKQEEEVASESEYEEEERLEKAREKKKSQLPAASKGSGAKKRELKKGNKDKISEEENAKENEGVTEEEGEDDKREEREEEEEVEDEDEKKKSVGKKNKVVKEKASGKSKAKKSSVAAVTAVGSKRPGADSEAQKKPQAKQGRKPK